MSKQQASYVVSISMASFLFDENHPVQVVVAEIIQHCQSLDSTAVSVTTCDCSLPLSTNNPISEKESTTCADHSTSNEREPDDMQSAQISTDAKNTFLGSNDTSIRSSLFESAAVQDHIRQLRSNNSPTFIAYGDSYRRSLIDTEQQPTLLHNELILAKLLRNTAKNRQEYQASIASVLSRIAPADSCLNFADIADDQLPVCYKPWLRSATKVTCTYTSTNRFTTASCNQVQSIGKADPAVASTCESATVTKTLGYLALLMQSSAEDEELQCEQLQVMCFICDVDSLALCKFDIPDYRLLLSENSAVLDQFRLRNSKASSSFKYNPVSLHPPLWRHDLSFWENPNETTDEDKLVNVIHDIAGDVVTRIFLMNLWTDPDTALISRCYRIVYQSLDKPLSHTDAHDIQNSVRLTVAAVLNVQLR